MFESWPADFMNPLMSLNLNKRHLTVIDLLLWHILFYFCNFLKVAHKTSNITEIMNAKDKLESIQVSPLGAWVDVGASLNAQHFF